MCFYASWCSFKGSLQKEEFVMPITTPSTTNTKSYFQSQRLVVGVGSIERPAREYLFFLSELFHVL